MTTEEWDRAENKRKYDAMSQSERDAIDRAYFKRMKDRDNVLNRMKNMQEPATAWPIVGIGEQNKNNIKETTP